MPIQPIVFGPPDSHAGTSLPAAGEIIDETITQVNTDVVNIAAVTAAESVDAANIASTNTTVAGQAASIATLNSEFVNNTLTTAYVTTIKSDYVDPRDFTGWDRTGTNPVDSILQTAIGQSISAGVQLRIPAGMYLLNNTVHLAPNILDSIDMVGSDTRAKVHANNFSNTLPEPRTIFKANFNNAPAFSLSGGRDIHLANFTVMGLNTAPNGSLISGVKSNYITAGMRDSQYSPYCGLAIDAFNYGSIPPDGGYPGAALQARYTSNQSGSDNALIENVSICNFVVGIGHNLTGAGSLTDSFTYLRCNVFACDTLVAVGQAQSKICIFMFGNFGTARVGFDGSNYGPGLGLPIPMYGLNLGGLDHVFDYPSNYGPFYMHDCYLESVRSLGTFGTNGSTIRGMMSIQNMQANFRRNNNGPLPPILLESFGQCDLKNMYIGQDTGTVTSWNMVSDIPLAITVENCSLSNTLPTGNVPFIGLSPTGSQARCVNSLANGVFPAMPMVDESTSDVSTCALHNRFTGTIRASRYANGTGETFYQSPNVTGSIVATASSIALTTQAITFTSGPLSGATSATLSSSWTVAQTGWYLVTFSNAQVLTVLLTNGSTAANWINTPLTSNCTTSATVQAIGLTFTAADPTLFQVGDNLFWQMQAQNISQVKRTVLAWVVSSVVSSTVTCTAMFDITRYDTAANNPTTSVTIAQTQWAPTTALTCTTATSTTLTAVSPTNLLQNGDWVQGTGLAANSRVVSGAGTSTIVLNKATTASASGINLYFGRLQTPTQTPTW